MTGEKHSLALVVAYGTVVTDSTQNVTAKTHILALVADYLSGHRQHIIIM